MWIYIVVVALLILGGYGFWTMISAGKRNLTRRPTRSMDDMYSAYGDSTFQQWRYAKRHDGTWRDGDGDSSDG